MHKYTISSSTLKPSFWPCTQRWQCFWLTSVESMGCAEALELWPRKGKARVWHSVLTTLPGGILGSQTLGTDRAEEASGELENMWQTDLLTGLFLAPLGKNPQPTSSPKAGEIKANCTISVLFLIYSVNIRIKERKVGGKRERDNKMRRGQRKWKAWDIWTAVREATGKTLDSWRHFKEFYF